MTQEGNCTHFIL